MNKALIGLAVLLVFGAVIYVGASGMLNRAGKVAPPAAENEKHNALYVSNDSFEEDVLRSDKVVLVDFWAPWCGPCLQLGPTIEELAIEYDGQAVIAKVNVDEASDIAIKYNIESIPALLYFKNGEVVDSQIGVQSHSAIADKLDALIND